MQVDLNEQQKIWFDSKNNNQQCEFFRGDYTDPIAGTF